LTLALAVAGIAAAEEALEQIVAAAEVLRQVAAALTHFGLDVDDRLGVVLGDRAERGRVDRAGQRRAVDRRYRDGLRRRGRREIQPRRDDHADRHAGDSRENDVK